MCSVVVEYKDTDSGEVFEKQVLKGEEGEGFTVQRSHDFDIAYDYVNTSGSESGKFSKTEQTITYNYQKFAGNIYNITVNYLREGDKDFGTNDSEMSPSTVIQVREGTAYTAPIKKIDNMKLDMEKFPVNATSSAYGDETVDYYYIQEPASDLVVHYYNAAGWKKVFAYIYSQNEEETEEYNGKKPGNEMKADGSLGEGWFTLTLKNKGTLQGVTAVFSDGGEKNVDVTEYSVDHEVWISDGAVKHKGEVNVIYADNQGHLLATETIVGQEGTDYKTEQKTFENCTFSNATSNTDGKITESPTYVFYVYENQQPVPDQEDNSDMIKLVVIVLGASVLTFAAAGIVGAIYNKRKKRWDID